jgi:diguanylate cyclase (GGDEF)-like protein
MNQPVFHDCLTAQLHRTAAIQPHGALLVVDENHAIAGASENIGQWLHQTPTQILGKPWSALFPDISLPEALGELSNLGIAGMHLRPYRINGYPVIMAGHKAGRHSIIELEEGSGFSNELLRSRGAVLASCIAQLGQQKTPQQAAECLMRFIALSIGFDRVMLLQFMPDWHGKVTAEQLKPDMRSYLHQHFPANDIPQNARTLYLLKRQRLISNARADVVPIVSNSTEPFDLTFSELRAVHPAHLQYMKNMGVASSFSVSIVVDNVLWGLVVCHNLRPRTLPFSIRQLCEHMANIAGLHISGLQKLSTASAQHMHHICRTHLKQDLLNHGLSRTAILAQLEHVRRSFQADGVWFHQQGTDYTCGRLPGTHVRPALLQWLQTHASEPVCGYSDIPAELQHIDDLVTYASGVLFIRIAENDFLALVRSEQQENIEWAGPPEPAGNGLSEKQLSPRTSFESWKELTAGQAVPWADVDYEAAHELRLVLRELLDYLLLEQQSLTDPLTGLGNRQQLQNYLEKRPQATDGTLTAVLLVDLDHFKPINDTYGHAAGDQVLTEVGRRMSHLLRDTDLLVRLGGDEFAIVLPGQKSTDSIQALGERIIDAITQPYQLAQGTAHISASIGAALFSPETGLDIALHNADMAMYSVKRGGRNGFALFSGTNP